MRYLTACICFFSFIFGGMLLLRKLSFPSSAPQTTTPAPGSSLKSQVPYHTLGNLPPPLPAREPSADPDRVKPGSRFTLELAKVTSQIAAENWLDRLKEAGVQGFYTPFQSGTEVIYKIRSGIYRNKKQATRARQALRVSHRLNSEVVSL